MADEISTLGIKVDSRQVKSADAALDGLTASATNAEKATDGLTSSSKKADTATGSFSSTIKTATAALKAYAAVNISGKLKDAADDYISVQNALRQVTTGTENLTTVTKELFATANQSRADIGATSSLYQKLAMSSKELGLSQRELISITGTINKSFALSGASASEASGSIRQLGQALASGVLRGDEFNSIAEQAPGIMRAIAEETGKTTGELREFAAEGGITADIVINALQSASESIDRDFGNSVITFDQRMQLLSNRFVEFAGENENLNSLIDSSATAMAVLAEAGLFVVDVIATLLNGTVELISWFGKLITSQGETEKATTTLLEDFRELTDFWRGYVIAGLAVVGKSFVTVAEHMTLPFVAAFQTIRHAVLGWINTMVDGAIALAKFAGVSQETIDKLELIKTPLGSLGTEIKENMKKFGEFKDGIDDFAVSAIASDRATKTYAKTLTETATAVVKTTKVTDKARKEQDKYEKSLRRVRDALDPVGAKIREAKEQLELLYKAFKKGDITETEFNNLAKVIGDSLAGAGDKSGKSFSEAFMSQTSNIGDSLQDAIISGDWDGIGSTIGGILSNSAATAVQGLFAKSSGLIGSLAGGIAGGVVGSLVGTAIEGIKSLIGDVVDPTEARQAAQGTGTVLGSINEKSLSIANSNELIASTSSELLNVNMSMLDRLSTLSGAISNVTATVAQARTQTGIEAPELSNLFNTSDLKSGLTGQILSGGLLDAILPGLGGLLSAGAKSKQIDEGIQIIGGQIQDVIDNTVVEGFASFKVRKNYLDDYDLRERFVSLGDNVNDQVGGILSGILDTVASGVGALGVSDAQIKAALEDFAIETQKISLEGLDAAAQEAEIQAVFSKIFDEVTTEVISDTLPFLKDLANAGEGLGETLTRVTTQFQTVEEAATSLGFKFLGTTESLVNASDSLVQRLGGVEAFSAAITSFERNFLSTEEQISNQSRRLNEALSAVGLQLPETKEGFRDLVRELSATNDADQEAIALLLTLQGTASSYYSQLEQSLQDTGTAIETVVDIVDTLKQAISNAASASDTALSNLKASVETERSEITTTYNDAVKERKNALNEELTALKNAGSDRIKQIKKESSNRATAIRNVEKDRLRANAIAVDAAKTGLSAITAELNGIISALDKFNEKAISGERRRARALEVLNAALRTGNLTGTGDAANIAADINASDFGSALEFREQVGVTRAVLSQLEQAGTEQKSDAEKVIESLEMQATAIQESADRAIEANSANTELAIEASKANTDYAIEVAKAQAEEDLAILKEQFDEDMARLDQIIENAVDQLNVLRNIDAGILSVEQAVSAFGSALVAERTARQELEREIAQQETETTQESAVPAVPVSGGFLPAIQNIDPSVGNLASIPQFADGGVHSGGARIVGDGGGPELEFTGPSRIISHQDFMNAMNNTALENEVKQLREDMKRVLTAIAISTNTTAKKIQRWDGQGLPNFIETQPVEVV